MSRLKITLSQKMNPQFYRYCCWSIAIPKAIQQPSPNHQNSRPGLEAETPLFEQPNILAYLLTYLLHGAESFLRS